MFEDGVEDGAFSNKIDCFEFFLENFNLKGHLNHFVRSKVTAILVNQGILPSGGLGSALQPATSWTLKVNLKKSCLNLSYYSVHGEFNNFGVVRVSGPIEFP